MRVSRITEYLRRKCPLGIDLDNPSQFELLKAYFNARLLGGVRLYRTEHGYHLKVNVPTSIEHRMGLGDDKRRIYLSELRGGDDVLFDVKNGRRVEELDDDWILREPFWYMPRRKRKSSIYGRCRRQRSVSFAHGCHRR